MTDKFHGQPVAILASGPSLTEHDIDLVGQSGITTIAVNTTWEKARFCDVIVAADNRWWVHNEHKIDVGAERVTLSYRAHDFGALRFQSRIAKFGYNSGCIAAEYAISQGAGRVILLGMDCTVHDGAHHHDPHHWSDPDEASCDLWRLQFKRLRKLYPDADVVNCSRETALEWFPRADLESVLCALG